MKGMKTNVADESKCQHCEKHPQCSERAGVLDCSHEQSQW